MNWWEAESETLGLVLADRTGASRRVVSLFAFLHDSCRWDDYRDAGHGARAAD